jgi:uncharacterized protein with NRDE domain
MCILMVVYKRVKDYPIVLGANRDEYLDRPTQEPDILRQAPIVWGGRDVRAGGTWLGVNEHGLVVGLTNRRMTPKQENDPTRRSRGLLCLDVLQCRTPEEVTALLTDEPPDRYNPCNLLIADQSEAHWIAYEGTPETHCITAGLHILANGNLNDFETVRIRRARHLLDRTEHTEFHTLSPFLERVCRDHEVGVQDRETICMHRQRENYGTVSSTILALTPDFQGNVYRYAAGAPCSTQYKDYSHLFSTVS